MGNRAFKSWNELGFGAVSGYEANSFVFDKFNRQFERDSAFGFYNPLEAVAATAPAFAMPHSFGSVDVKRSFFVIVQWTQAQMFVYFRTLLECRSVALNQSHDVVVASDVVEFFFAETGHFGFSKTEAERIQKIMIVLAARFVMYSHPSQLCWNSICLFCHR